MGQRSCVLGRGGNVNEEAQKFSQCPSEPTKAYVKRDSTD